jgi:hypothetical protein
MYHDFYIHCGYDVLDDILFVKEFGFYERRFYE